MLFSCETFLTRDLVFALNRSPRYWTAVLSEKPTRLLDCTRNEAVEVEEGGFPMVHEGPGGQEPLPGGFGVNKSALRDERHRQFFRAIDAGFKQFMADDPLPLAIVGVDRYLAFFREMTAHGGAIMAELKGSHDKTAPQQVADLVWPQIQAGFEKRRLGILDDLGKAVGSGKYASGPGEAWRMAVEGRGKTLLVEEDFHFPATKDETRGLVPAEDPAAPGVIDDVVDEIIEGVIARQGEVVFVANGSLGAHQRIALILRY